MTLGRAAGMVELTGQEDPGETVAVMLQERIEPGGN